MKLQSIIFRIALLAIALLTCGCGSTYTEVIQPEKRLTAIELDHLRAEAPREWIEKAPDSADRHAVFELPSAAGDVEPAKLVVFKGLKGTPEANIKRWQMQFTPPKGKKIEEVSKIDAEFDIGGIKGMRIDVHGTFNDKPPMAPHAAGTMRRNYQLVGIHWEGPRNVYHIKLTGPRSTVQKHLPAFEQWLKSFSASN